MAVPAVGDDADLGDERNAISPGGEGQVWAGGIVELEHPNREPSARGREVAQLVLRALTGVTTSSSSSSSGATHSSWAGRPTTQEVHSAI